MAPRGQRIALDRILNRVEIATGKWEIPVELTRFKGLVILIAIDLIIRL